MNVSWEKAEFISGRIFMAEQEFEWLTDEICKEFLRRAKEISPSGATGDTGAMRELRIELQRRCNIPEVWAYNILRGRNVKDYVQYCGILSGAIPMTEEMKKRIEQSRKREEHKDEKKKTKDQKLREYADRIAYLESLALPEEDEFGFEEKDT